MAGPEGYKIFRCSSENDVLECASIVKDGGIVVYPTDTVYGIKESVYYCFFSYST